MLLRYLRLITASALMFGLVACQTVRNPATGEDQFTTITPAQERRIGAQEHPRILAQFGGEVTDGRLKSYVEGIGQRLAAQAEIPADQFTFTILDSPVVNAFALPGGYVYVTRGLISILNSDAELAGVIGHEIGHVTARHGATRQTRGTFANLAVAGAAILTGSKEVAQLGQTAAASYLASYSRDQERQSDSLGIRYLSKAGYDPLAMSGGLAAIGRQGALLNRMAGREAREVSSLSTHPQTPERVAATRAEATRTRAQGRVFTGRDPFLNAIDGMIYGDSPQQGFVRGNRFSHPLIRFTFTVPDSFTLDNLPQAVVANERQGRARIIFDQEPDPRIARGNFAMDRYIAGHWAKGARLFDLDRITIDGMAAATAVAQINSGSQRLDARLIAIRFDSQRLFRFVFLTPVNLTRSFTNAFRETTFSFRRLDQREASQLQPDRINVQQIRPNDSITSLTRNSPNEDGFARERFLVINGMDADGPLQAGERIKVIRR